MQLTTSVSCRTTSTQMPHSRCKPPVKTSDVLLGHRHIGKYGYFFQIWNANTTGCPGAALYPALGGGVWKHSRPDLCGL